MPNLRYYNQTAPFWDWVANLEEQGASHPFFGNADRRGDNAENEQQRPNPWTEGWAGFPFGPLPHRGRHGHHQGPPPPNAAAADYDMTDTADEKHDDPQEGSSEPRGPPPPFEEAQRDRGDHRHRGPHHGPGSRGRCGRRGGWGGRSRGGPFGHPAFGAMGGFGGLADMFQSQMFGNNDNNSEDKAQDFKPDVDVFDTPESFVVHVSLPGAKKEDVGVNWDSEKSELNIAGVVYRPGDEELLKTLALDERKAGAFERKVRLGSRANPAQVDVDGISAKLEDGVLRVDVPKLDAGYVEIKKVDIE